MAFTLHLTVRDYLDPAHWRWVLADDRGKPLADHTVHLDQTRDEYKALDNLDAYLDFRAPIAKLDEQLLALGEWIGEQSVRTLHQTAGRAVELRVLQTPSTPGDPRP
jgi:hypothetical protein